VEKWELAAKKFIDSWQFTDDIESVFLTGSHASGNADEFSDVDLFIILNDNVKWRERGNKMVDGLLVEYFANPVRQVKKHIDECYGNADLIDINMILGGKVILDRNAAADKIIDYCKQKMTTEFPSMSGYDVYMGLYLLWDAHDELQRAYSNKTPGFTMQFFSFVQNAFVLYSRYTCSPVPSYHKLYKWLTDDGYFKKYGLAAHNDLYFVEMIKATFHCKDINAMFETAKNIYVYVVDKMGGIDIDNFVLHGSCD